MKKMTGPTATAIQILIILCTYLLAFILLQVGDMNPAIVALLPCLAITLSTIISRFTMR